MLKALLFAIIISQMVVIAALTLTPPTLQHHQKEQPAGEKLGKKGDNDKADARAGANPAILQIECDPSCIAKEADKGGNEIDVARLFYKFIGDPIAILTAVLAIANGLLTRLVMLQIRDSRRFFEGQSTDMKASIAVARDAASAADKAANAAMLQANAAINMELPSIRFSEFELIRLTTIDGDSGVIILRGLDLPEFCSFNFLLSNSGRTDATLLMYAIECEVAIRLPPSPAYREFLPFIPGTALPPGDDYKRTVDRNFQLQEGERAAVRNQQRSLWIYGCVKYLDFMNFPHERRFCHKWDGDRRYDPGFVVDPNTPEEYVRGY